MADTAPHRRRVHFATYLDSNLVPSPTEKIYEYPAIPEDHLLECFYSRKETIELRRLETDLAKRYKRSQGDEIASCIRCLHASLKQFDVSTVRGMTESEAVQRLSESDARGLEHLIVSALIKHRKWGINKILVVQEANRKRDPAQLETILRVWSLQVSAASSDFARMIARADESFATADGATECRRSRFAHDDST